MVACPEEIAWRNGWLNHDELNAKGEFLKKITTDNIY